MVAQITWVQYRKSEMAKKTFTEEGYQELRSEFIKINEEFRETAYNDGIPKDGYPKGLKTVGFGFNMDAEGARKLWENAFKDIPGVSFDNVYNGIRNISPKEANTLFNYVL